MPRGPKSRQVPELDVEDGAAALTETEAPPTGAPPTETFADAPDEPTATPTPVFAVPAETIATTDVPEDPVVARTLAEPLPEDAPDGTVATTVVVPVDELPTDTLTPVVLEGPVDAEVAGAEAAGDAVAEGEAAGRVGLLAAGEVREREVSATPPLLGAGDADAGREFRGAAAACATWPDWMPDGDPGPAPDGPCKIRTDTEVSRNKTINDASPNIGTMLPAGCSRTMAARLRPDLRTRSMTRANASWAGGSGGFWPRRAA
jgi:hypothetical protein